VLSRRGGHRGQPSPGAEQARAAEQQADPHRDEGRGELPRQQAGQRPGGRAEGHVEAGPERRPERGAGQEPPVRHPQPARGQRQQRVEHRQEGRDQHHPPTAGTQDPLGRRPAGFPDPPADPAVPQPVAVQPAGQEAQRPAGQAAADHGGEGGQPGGRPSDAHRGEDRDVAGDQHAEQWNGVEEHDHAEHPHQ
jgi:hypothetical protein